MERCCRKPNRLTPHQVDFLRSYLDVAAQRSFMTGMHVWAFGDFKTGQSSSRAGSTNFKGMFTRDRRTNEAETPGSGSIRSSSSSSALTSLPASREQPLADLRVAGNSVIALGGQAAQHTWRGAQ
jgi:hypothetical protein